MVSIVPVSSVSAEAVGGRAFFPGTELRALDYPVRKYELAKAATPLFEPLKAGQESPLPAGIAAAEEEWSASQLCARLLQLASAAQPIASTPALEDWTKRGLLHRALDRYRVPFETREKLRQAPLTGELAALETAVIAIDAARELAGAFALPKTDVAAQVDLHRGLFPRTPGVDELESQMFFVADDERFLLPTRLQESPWLHLGAKIAARTWLETVNADARLRLEGWLCRTEDLDAWIGAPAQLSSASRAPLLDAMVDAVLDMSEETQGQPTILAAFRTTQEQEHAHYREARFLSDSQTLETLIASIVTSDTSDGAYAERYSRIQALLRASLKRPLFALHVPNAITRLRPEALPWLLTAPDLVPIALALVTRVDLSRLDSAWLEWSERETEQQKHRSMLWSKAVGIMTATLGERTSDPASAAAVSEVLIDAARQAESLRWSIHPERTRIRAGAAQERLGHLLAAVEGLEAGYVVRGPEGSRRPGLLDLQGSELGKQLLQSAKAAKEWPVAELRTLCWLCSVLPRRKLKVDDVADEVVRIYREHIDAEDSKYFEPLGVAECQWRYVLVFANFERTRFLEGPALADAQPEAHVHRLRLHLRILLRARSAAPAEVEAAIVTLLKTARDRKLNVLSAELDRPTSIVVPRLLSELAEGLNVFAPDRSAEALAALTEVSDLDAHLELARVMKSAGARETLLREATAIDLDQDLARPRSPHEMARLLQFAIEADQAELAKRVLEFGDKRFVQPGDWHYLSFGLRALMVGTEGGASAIDALPAPEGAEEDIDRTRRFVRGVVLLRTDAAAAECEFAALLREEPSSANAVNLFAARLKIAAETPNPEERRNLYLAAERSWRRAIEAFSEQERALVHENAIFNQLTAFEGAAADDEFDQTFAALDQVRQLQLPILELRLQNLKRRGQRDEATRLLARARDFHRGPGGIGEVKVDELARAVELEASAMLPSVASARQQAEARVAKHRAELGNLRRMRPEHLAAVAGETETTSLAEFLLEEMIVAATELQLHVNVLQQLALEDEYNDIYVSMLRMRLSAWHWQILDQTRGGQSDGPGKQAGRRDWTYRGSNGQELALAEAYRLTSVNTTAIDKHLGKLEKYDPVGHPQHFVVVYAEGLDLDQFWPKYVEHVGKSRPEKFGEHTPVPGRMRVGKVTYAREGRETSVFHLVLKVKD